MHTVRKGEYTIHIYIGEFDEDTLTFYPEQQLYKSFPMMYNSKEDIKTIQANLVANLFLFDIRDIYTISRFLLGYFPAHGIVNTINLDGEMIN